METLLYQPVKKFLEGEGYAVKGEIGHCDLVGLREGEATVVVICELKTSINLQLILQGVDRLKLGDEVWLASPLSPNGKGRESDPRFRDLCRRLGFGLLGVCGDNQVRILISPSANLPRKDTKRRSRIVEEHRRRRGDPVEGGGTRKPILTAYRQRALGCASAMTDSPQRPRDLKLICPDAQKILHRNVYGWFRRGKRGYYDLTQEGREGLDLWLGAAKGTMPACSSQARF